MDKDVSIFAGSIPSHYDMYLGPMLFQPYARDLAARAASFKPTKVLETAAGTGIATQFLREVLPGQVPIMATDLNEPMLQIARRKFAAGQNVEFKCVDALSLPFDEREYDCVFCQFGVMFFPDKLAAFTEVLRVLKPMGRFIFNVWDSIDQNPLLKAANQFFESLYPNDPPTFYKTPFGYHRLDPIKETLEAAGFTAIETSVLKFPCISSSACEVATGLIEGNPISLQILERKQHTLEEAKIGLESVIASQFGKAPVRSTMQAIAIQAMKPNP